MTSASRQHLQPTWVWTCTTTGFYCWGKPSACHTPRLQFHDI